MESDKKLYNVTKEVLTFVAFKLDIINELPVVNVPYINTELVNNLRMIVWVERYVSIEDSKKFMWKHFARMTATPQLYTTYVIYACQLVTKAFTDPYEAFVRTLTLVVQMALYSMPTRLPELLGWTLAIFTNIFEKDFKSDFCRRGGWKKLNKYLLKKNSLGMYSTVEMLEVQGKRPDEMVELLQVQTTPLEEYLSKDVTELEIETHGPTVLIWEMVQTTGFNAGAQFMCDLMETQARTAVKNPTNVATASPVFSVKDSKGNIQQLELIQPVVKSGTTNRIAYSQAKESLRGLQADCLRIEHLLDVIFGDISD